MSRPILLAFLLLVLLITSQVEWRQPLVSDIEASPTISLKQQQIAKKQEAVKGKIILSQEKNIQRLNDLVKTLREQLLQCQSKNKSMNIHLMEKIIELERQPTLEN